MMHPSTIICPLTTNVRKDWLLRVHVPLRGTGIEQASDILVDQVRAIDTSRRFSLGVLQKNSNVTAASSATTITWWGEWVAYWCIALDEFLL